MPTSSGLIFHPPRDLKLERLVALTRTAAEGGADDEQDEAAAPIDVSAFTLIVAPVTGTGLLRVEVDGPEGRSAASLLDVGEELASSRVLTLAWWFSAADVEQALTVHKDGARVIDHALDEEWQVLGGVPDAALRDVLVGLPAGDALRLGLGASQDEVTRREADFTALLTRLGADRAADEKRVLDVVQGAIQRTREKGPAAAAAAPAADIDPARTRSDPTAVKKADRQAILFLIISLVLLGGLGAFLAFHASRAPG